jgi:hypothetical protein
MRESTSITSDTPVPYRISDLMRLIEERIGKLEGRNGPSPSQGAEEPHRGGR